MSTLNLTESPAQILFDVINSIGGTSLLPTDYTIGVPTPADPVNQPALTSITVTPIASGSPITVHYNRINIADILASNTVQVLALTGTHLSDIITEINTDYSINLTSNDYINAVLPVINSAVPNAPRYVTIAIQSTSIMYYGVFNFQLGPRSLAAPANGNIVCMYYVFNPGTTISNYQDTILSYNADNSINSGFNCLSNISSVSVFQPDTMFGTSNGNLMLLGNFAFSYPNNPNTIGIQSIVVNPLGAVVSTYSTRLNNQNANITYPDGTFDSYVAYVVPQTLSGSGSGTSGNVTTVDQEVAVLLAQAQTYANSAMVASAAALGAVTTMNSIEATVASQVGSIQAAVNEAIATSILNSSLQEIVLNSTVNPIIFGQPVYCVLGNTIDVAVATDIVKKDVMGLVISPTIGAGLTGDIITFGELVGTVTQWGAVTGEVNGLTPDAEYFLDVTAGKITSTAPMSTAAYLCSIGTARTNTALSINISQPIQL